MAGIERMVLPVMTRAVVGAGMFDGKEVRPTLMQNTLVPEQVHTVHASAEGGRMGGDGRGRVGALDERETGRGA